MSVMLASISKAIVKAFHTYSMSIQPARALSSGSLGLGLRAGSTRKQLKVTAFLFLYI